MELILQTGLTHQQKAVDSIADVFLNTSISQPNQYYSNPSISPDSILLGNIQKFKSQ
jgi:type III restriction enzyme